MLIAMFAFGFVVALALVLAFSLGVRHERRRQAAMSAAIDKLAEGADAELTAALAAIAQPPIRTTSVN